MIDLNDLSDRVQGSVSKEGEPESAGGEEQLPDARLVGLVGEAGAGEPQQEGSAPFKKPFKKPLKGV